MFVVLSVGGCGTPHYRQMLFYIVGVAHYTDIPTSVRG